MFETLKEVDDDTVTKDINISLKMEPTASLLSGNVDHSDTIDTLFIIEADVTKNKS